MSNVIYGTKALGERIQQWQGPGTPNANHVGSYFAGGHGAEPKRVRASAKELRSLYRRLDLTTPQADMEHLSKVIRDLESLLPRENPTKSGGMTTAEAVAAIPRSEIRWLVGEYHVDTPSAEIEERIRTMATKAKWPAAAVRAGVIYARKCHSANVELFRSGRF
jgi:hypothetical protein